MSNLKTRLSRLEVRAADREAMQILRSLSDADLTVCLQELGRYDRLFPRSGLYDHLSDEELTQRIAALEEREKQGR